MTVRELNWIASPHSARLRIPRFVEHLPVALEQVAECANDIAGRLRSLLEAPVAVRMLPPIALNDEEWTRVRAGARTYALQGVRADATLVVDEGSARRIAAIAFGEHAADGPLSSVEARIVDRCIGEIAAGLQPLCGDVVLAGVSAAAGCVYCELRLGPPLDAALGIALHERPRAGGPTLGPYALEECPIECWVRLGAANVDIFTVAGFSVGDVLRLETKVGAFATLNLGAEPIAVGEGGVLGDRSAFKVHELI